MTEDKAEKTNDTVRLPIITFEWGVSYKPWDLPPLYFHEIDSNYLFRLLFQSSQVRWRDSTRSTGGNEIGSRKVKKIHDTLYYSADEYIGSKVFPLNDQIDALFRHLFDVEQVKSKDGSRFECRVKESKSIGRPHDKIPNPFTCKVFGINFSDGWVFNPHVVYKEDRFGGVKTSLMLPELRELVDSIVSSPNGVSSISSERLKSAYDKALDQILEEKDKVPQQIPCDVFYGVYSGSDRSLEEYENPRFARKNLNRVWIDLEDYILIIREGIIEAEKLKKMPVVQAEIYTHNPENQVPEKQDLGTEYLGKGTPGYLVQTLQEREEVYETQAEFKRISEKMKAMQGKIEALKKGKE
ncbi:MAG: hypothetical protein ABII01_06365 [Candidatus Woesearchaeota archaeon]